MAVVSVPRPLRDQLGDAAADSLVDMLRHFEDDQEQRRAIQKEHLLEVPDERFLRHLAETEERLRKEIGTLRAEVGNQIGDVRKEIGTLRTDLGNQIADMRKELRTLRTAGGSRDRPRGRARGGPLSPPAWLAWSVDTRAPRPHRHGPGYGRPGAIPLRPRSCGGPSADPCDRIAGPCVHVCSDGAARRPGSMRWPTTTGSACSPNTAASASADCLLRLMSAPSIRFATSTAIDGPLDLVKPAVHLGKPAGHLGAELLHLTI